MGHYDDAREAHEERLEQEAAVRKGRQFLEVVANRSEEELGRLLWAYDKILETASYMAATRSQHNEMEQCRGVISKFHERR